MGDRVLDRRSRGNRELRIKVKVFDGCAIK
jgi:hypothetical protein